MHILLFGFVLLRIDCREGRKRIMYNDGRIPGLTVVYMLVLLPFMRINAFNQLLPGFMHEAWQVIGMMSVVLLVVKSHKRLKPDSYFWLFTLFQGIVFASTIRHQRVSLGILNVMVLMICLVILLQIHQKYIITAILYVVVPVAMLNCCTMLAGYSPNNLDNLFGGSNQLSMLLVPTIFLLYLHNGLKMRSKNSDLFLFLYVLVVLVSVFKGKSATGIIVVTFACFLLLFYSKRKPNVKGIIFGIIIINLILLVSSSFLYNSRIWLEVTGLLGKDSSLSSRNILWEKMYDMLKGHWIFGVGRGFSVELISRYGEVYYFEEAHNFWLEILCEAGVVGFGIYLYMFLRTVFRMDMSQKTHKIVFFAICVCMINGLTEANNNLVIVNLIFALANEYVRDRHKKMNMQEMRHSARYFRSLE